jgi:hypothetical protein
MEKGIIWSRAVIKEALLKGVTRWTGKECPGVVVIGIGLIFVS